MIDGSAPTAPPTPARRPALRPLRRTFSRLSRHRAAFVLVGLLSLLINATVTLYTGVPSPDIPDEFSYLLAADTFAHGRLTNPTPPLWQHFETFHVLLQPTYQSKYPPGQGLILALGQVLTGQPIVGAFLATALACAAICWALRPWVGPRWAFLAGLFASLHVLLIFFAQNYWGGGLAAFGGAVVFGAVARLWHRPSALHGALLVAGLGVLSNSRPYEGAVLGAILVAALAWHTVGERTSNAPPTWPTWRGTLSAALAVATAFAAWALYYDYRVTGHPLVLPYTVYEADYARAKPFLFQSPWPAKTYRHETLRVYNQQTVYRDYLKQRTWPGFAAGAWEKLRVLARAFGHDSILALGLLALPWAMAKQRRVRWLAAATLLFLAALLPETWMFPHYAAPAFVILLFLEISGWRILLGARRLRRASILAMLAMLALSSAAAAHWASLRSGSVAASPGRQRDQIIAELLRRPGDDLILVHPDTTRYNQLDWVYNAADIDHSPVIWAQDMGEAKNRDLLRYYAGRHVWLLRQTPDGVLLEPYREQG